MKIVINGCFGGFSLSIEGEKEYAKLKGFELFFYEQTKHEYKDGKDEYRRVEAKGGVASFCYALKKDIGDIVDKLPEGEDVWFFGRDVKRDDEDLVKMIELDSKKYSGDCASLKVVEIPDGIKWEIEEYDGSEHISEVHRTWG